MMTGTVWHISKITAWAMLLANTKVTRVCQYRFHPEGIPFGQSIRITIYHGEFDEIAGNYSSVAYWYQ